MPASPITSGSAARKAAIRPAVGRRFATSRRPSGGNWNTSGPAASPRPVSAGLTKLTAAATSDQYFDMVQAVFGSWIGKLVLFGFTWALIHHTLGGIRHLVWDMGRGFDLKDVEMGARLTLAGSIILTIIVWAIALGVS